MRHLMLAAAFGAALWIPLSGRADETPLETAAFAWDRGDYIAALTTYLELLGSNPSADVIEAIALQTGELFHTTELTTDGAAPRFSPDGRHILYETASLPEQRIQLMATDAPGRITATLQGFAPAFSPDGSRLAYLKVTPSPTLDEAFAAIGAGPANERAQRTAAFNARVRLESQVVIRELGSGRETVVPASELEKSSLTFSSKGLLLAAAPPGGDGQIYLLPEGGTPAPLTSGEGDKIIGAVSRDGRALTYTVRPGGAGRGGRGGGRADGQTFFLLTVDDGRSTSITGSAPAFSADGTSLAWVARSGPGYQLLLAPVAEPSKTAVLRSGPARIDAPAFSPNGLRVAYQVMPKEDWEIHVIGRDGENDERITREIQHDLMPTFLDDERLLGMMGESRHRRSHIYDLATKERTKLFHNNTVRTIAPEYQWIPSLDGRRILIVAERDGDTVSPERGVYLVDLSRRITADELRARVTANLASEQALRSKTERLFAPIADEVRKVVAEASVGRVYSYEKALFDFDSKHITQPGNKLAGEYLFEKYASFGYSPEYQWFAGRNALGGQTANVLATLKGTVNPELVYVVSSHYDSVAAGPGADDDTSGTAALLEAARILSKHPQPATIIFASFTGEEAGLLGSREFVRQAVASGMQLVGALNNDMIGWANDHRLDNTIRYSNPGIRDIQHGAAMHFTDLITYDALYYKSTDAAAYYEAYGDIVGGIGSYPVLGNPHYHQPHDLLETINHQLVTEVAKTTAATLMLLASSPARLADLTVDSFTSGTARLSWRPSPENGVTGYLVSYGPPSNPHAQQARVKSPSVTLSNVTPGTIVSVKAVNQKGLEGWDWARTELE